MTEQKTRVTEVDFESLIGGTELSQFELEAIYERREETQREKINDLIGLLTPDLFEDILNSEEFVEKKEEALAERDRAIYVYFKPTLRYLAEEMDVSFEDALAVTAFTLYYIKLWLDPESDLVDGHLYNFVDSLTPLKK